MSAHQVPAVEGVGTVVVVEILAAAGAKLVVGDTLFVMRNE